MAEVTIQQLFRYVEEKIVGIEMLLKYGLGYSKSFDKQLRKPIDFNSLDHLIYDYQSIDDISHITFLENKYVRIYMNEGSIQALSHMDEIGLEFSNSFEIAKEIKEELHHVIKKLQFYISVLKGRSEVASFNGGLLASVVDYLLTIEIDRNDMFDYDTKEEGDIIRKNLEHFLSGKFDSINPKLRFTTKSKREGCAYYVIRFLAEKSGIEFSSIKNITINDLEFSADSLYRHNSKLKTHIENKTLPEYFQEFIDLFHKGISIHISE